MEPDPVAGGDVLSLARPRRGVTLPSGDVTFVFSDIVGSTRHLLELGEAFGPLLAVHQSLITKAMADVGGVLINAEGDELFFAYAEPARAVDGALAAQAALAAYPWPAGHPLQVRIGMHTGPARPIGRSYIALAVHQAARISAAGHGGQVLASAATAALVARPGRPLGRFRLKDFDEPVALVQYDDGTHPPLKVVPESVQRLVLPDTSFVGREDELDQLSRLFDSHRLVTISGPGGAGKTRLAVELASRTSAAVMVAVAELAGARNASEVESAVAAALNLAQSTDIAVLDLLTHYLGDLPDVLLVLDNCEQVLDAVAAFVTEVLRAAPNTRLLLTSREPLGTPEERLLRLAPLDPPEPGASLDDVLSCDAARLLVDRVVAKDSAFRLEPSDAEHVVAICTRLDGSPLALELVAAEVAAAGLSAARESIEIGTDIAGGRGRPERHRSVEAALDWSYQLLEPDERLVWARLAVFVSPFRIQDAVFVAAGEDLDQRAVLSAVSALVDKSVVTRVSAPDGDRYRMHQTVREFGYAKLREAGELEHLNDRHAEWAADFLLQNYLCVTPPKWFAAYGVCRDDLVASWHHLREVGHDELAAIIGGNTAYWDYFTGRSAEGAALLREVATWPDGPYLASALIQAAAVIGRSQHTAEARSYVEQALRHRLAPKIEAAARDTMIEICFEEGEFGSVEEHAKALLAAPASPDEPMAHAWALSMLGVCALCRGDLQVAADYLRRSHTAYVEIDHHLNACIVSANLASTALLLDNKSDARSYASEALRLAESANVADQACVARMQIAATNPPTRPNTELRHAVAGLVQAEMPLELGDFYHPLPVLMALQQWRALAVACGAFATVYAAAPNPFPLLDRLLDDSEVACRNTMPDSQYDELFSRGCATPTFAAILAALD